MEKKKVRIDSSVFNPAYLPILETKKDTVIVYGGSSSGKSYSLAQALVIDNLNNPDSNWLCVRKTGNTLKESCYNEIKSVITEWGLQADFHFTTSPMRILNLVQGNGIYFRGLDDVEKVKSIKPEKGVLTKIWVEEATETSMRDIKQLKLRLRGGSEDTTKQMYFTFNPISSLHWLKLEYFDKHQKNVFILKTTYRDNNFLTSQDRRVITEIEDSYYRKVYRDGEWGTLGNLIFDHFVVKPVEFEISDFDYFAYGGDYGYSNPSAVIGVGVKDDAIYIKQEVVYESGLTTQDLFTRLKEKNLPADIPQLWDSARKDFIVDIQRQGFNARGVKKTQGLDRKGFVISGIDFIRCRKLIVDPSCQHVINELQQYKRIEDKDGNATEDPLPINDHGIDAIRYALDPLRKPNITKATAVNMPA